MKIKKSTITIIFLLIPIFQPKLFTQISSLALLYSIFNIIVFAYLGYKVIGRGSKLPLPIIFWGIYRLYLLLVGIMNSNISGIMQWGYLTLMVANLMLIFEVYGMSNCENIIKYIAIITVVLIVINYLTLLIYPRGIIRSTFYDVEAGDYYLLGIKTQFTTMMFPALAASGLYALMMPAKGRNLLVVSVISCLATILNRSISTAIVGMLIFLIFIMLYKFLNIRYNEWICLSSCISVQILIVFYRIQNLLEGFIVNVLHKDATMSSRVNIWDNAIKLLNRQSVVKTLFGNGMFKNEEFVPYGIGFWQPHNQMLALLYPSGIIGTAIFMMLLYLLIKVSINTKEVQLLLMICMCVLILSVTEVYFDVATSYVPFVLTYYYQRFDPKGRKNRNYNIIRK